MPSRTDYLHWVSRKSYLANSLSEDYLGSLKQLFYGDQSAKIAITYKNGQESPR